MTATADDEHVVAVVADALERVAAELPPERALILAVCDAAGRPTDLLVRDRDGRVAVLAGVPADRRPKLAAIVGLTSELEQSVGKPEALRWPVPPTGGGERELLMRTIIERAPVPLMLADGEGTILHASAFASDFGYQTGELVGKRMLDYVHPDDRGRLTVVQAGMARENGGEAAIEIRWRRRDGDYTNAEARIRTAGDPHSTLAGGVVVGLRSLHRPWSGVADVVATKQRQRLLADASDCGVAIVAGAHETLGVVLDANAPFGRIMGMTTGQLVGSPLMALVADSDADRMRTTLERVARGGMQTLEVTLRGRLVGGRRAEVAVRADPDGAEPRELIVRVRDITEQMRLVAELSGAVGRLERTNHELAEFARVTAHDLSAPLLAASRLLDLVPDSSSDPDAPATLDAIRSAINRMRVMVDGVMGYAESLEAAPARPPVELSEPLQRVLDTLAEEIDRRQAVISVGKLPTVPGDEQQLERVFLNLISNALKFADDQPPRVRIEAHHEHATWRISVSDEGIGVPQTDGARIFELFGRSEATTSGRGIGLATCRRIVELHGGQIWVEPNEPSGSVFYFTLPTEPTVSSS